MKDKSQKAFTRKDRKAEEKKKKEVTTGIPIYNYWLFSILAMITTSMFRKKSGLEVIIQGTTHQISFFSISMITILLAAIFAAIYYRYRERELKIRLTNLHTLLTLGVIGTVFLTSFKEQLWDVDEIIVTGVGVFVIAQGILVGNILNAKPSK